MYFNIYKKKKVLENVTLNGNKENKLVKRVLVSVNSQVVGSKFQVNKDYTIQFSIKSNKDKVPNWSIQNL